MPLRNTSDLAPPAGIAARAVSGVAAGSSNVLAAGAKLADLSRALRGYRAPAPVMPPELAAKVDQALAAEVARRSSAGSRPPEPRPARPAAASADGRHDLIQVPAPRAPMAGF